MEIRSIDIEPKHSAGSLGADGIVVVIDVLRAFTSAAMMFRYGISEFLLVATAEEALDLRRSDPTWLLAGEVNGRKINSFAAFCWTNGRPLLQKQA